MEFFCISNLLFLLVNKECSWHELVIIFLNHSKDVIALVKQSYKL